uniref:Protein kinase domain-containing protein n=1 Tax=Fagus sylvatica TaxID=28930 RepID=A0A2N9FE68_FAGSY
MQLQPINFIGVDISDDQDTIVWLYITNRNSTSSTVEQARTPPSTLTQVFVADSNSKSNSFSTGKSEVFSNSSTSILELYQTARVYRQPCSYSIRNSTSSPVIKEFLLSIPQGEFRIHFIPSQQSSLAFVNAIEVFLANETRIIDNGTTRVTSAGNDSTYNGLLSQALHTIHRINFGGSLIEFDELWRSWMILDLPNFSISPSEQDSRVLNAFVNGLEIMEVMTNKSGSHSTGIKQNPDQGSHFGGISFNRLTEGSAAGSLPSNLNLSLRIPFAEIQYATKNFNSKLLIGEGGFGKVYKGTLRNGIRVAVKRSQPGHGQGIEEFQTEIIVLSQIRHRHLVSLIGYCDERSEMILVYEFMEKGTLRDHLYQSNDNSERSSSRSELSWKKRLEICIGAATGLRYLHTGPAGGIIHRDVKSTNILLDEDYVAKVADFGLSKSGLPDPEHFTMGVKDQAINNSLPMEEMNLAEWGMMQVSVQRPTMHEVLYDLQYALQLQETAMQRDPHEDSATNTSLELPLPLVWHLASSRIPIEEDGHDIRAYDDSDTTLSESRNPFEN